MRLGNVRVRPGKILAAAIFVVMALVQPGCRPASLTVGRGVPVITVGEESEGWRTFVGELHRDLGPAPRFASLLDALDRRERDRLMTLLRRDHQERRASAEPELDRIRSQAIDQLERFVEANPDNTDQTPDIMLRLVELRIEAADAVYAASLDQYDEALMRFESGEIAEMPPEPARNHSQVIELLRRFIGHYTSHPQYDQALYALGFCLQESGEFEEALLAWASLVCANRFTYVEPSPGAAPTPLPESASTYEGCQPVVANDRLLPETWFRLGEIQFDDAATPAGLEMAIGAYSQVLRFPDDRFRTMALYKLGWSYYRLDHYPQAIRRFVELIQASERPEADADLLRAEAIQYAAICLTEEDWDGDGQLDQAPTMARLQDPSLIPQDRTFTREIYLQAGNLSFDLTRYDDAIAIYELMLRRWPLSPEAPRAAEQIARAHERQRRFAEAIEARARLADFGPESQWARANRAAHPDEVLQAAVLARRALHEAPIFHHFLARELTARSSPEAIAEYRLAAEGYTRYLAAYPHDADLYELRFSQAEALYRSRQFRLAVEAFEWVYDSPLSNRFREEAAQMGRTAREAMPEETTPPPPSHPAPPASNKESKRRVIRLDNMIIDEPEPRRPRAFYIITRASHEAPHPAQGSGSTDSPYQSAIATWNLFIEGCEKLQKLSIDAREQMTKIEAVAHRPLAERAFLITESLDDSDGAAEPLTMVLVPLSEPSREPEVVLETLRQGREGLRRCFEGATKTGGLSDPEITIHFAIDSSGRSPAPVVLEEPREKVQDCVLPIIRALKFAPLEPSSRGSSWLVFLLFTHSRLPRTSLEDRTLRAELPGYAEFAQSTRYRLLPGVWQHEPGEPNKP